VPVPPFVPQTDDERRRHQAAKLRKELRQELERRQAEIRATPAGTAPAGAA
jgi:hypothetical protein